jgi:serine phosphatase RsbU (regulator of sigma subunit)
MMVLGSTFSVKQFGEEDMELLTSLASIAAMRIRNMRLTEEAVERKRLEADLALARSIQLDLLPDHLPEIAGYQLYGGNIPSRGASGDFFKVEERNDPAECVLFLADVSGKGIGAALITHTVDALATGPIELGLPPDEACERVSRRLWKKTAPEKYATAFLAVLEPASGNVVYTNAGHNPGLVVRADGSTEWLSSNGPPLGILEEATYGSSKTSLGIGDTLILYTDGMTEAENPDEEEFGEERLEAVCLEHRDKSVEEIADALHDNLERHASGIPFADDRTMVLVKREG